jgi:protein-tyrosine phosphatase
MGTELYWVDSLWPGKLALAARPRGGDWLADEIASWRRAGIDAVLSLLTPEEESELDLKTERQDAMAQGLEFISFPIPDREVPASEAEMASTLERLNRVLSSGQNIVIHCRQGIGRTGLVAACLLVSKGLAPEAAVRKLSTARGVAVPETSEQRHWIDHYSAISPSVK